VTIRLAVGHFLWVVYCDHVSILHRYGHMAPQWFCGHNFDLLGSRDISVTWLFDLR